MTNRFRHLIPAAALMVSSPPALADPAGLRAVAHRYYDWRDAAYPVATSSAGEHRFDSELTDFNMSAVLERRRHVSMLLAEITAMNDAAWSKDDRVDRLLIYREPHDAGGSSLAARAPASGRGARRRGEVPPCLC
jgi:uncharacterized protein (DUF885 family)